MAAIRTSHRQGEPVPLHERALTALDLLATDGGVTVLLSTNAMRQLVPGAPEIRVGDVGVVMSFVPLDISLRAYAIDGIIGVLADYGLHLRERRDVPIRPEMLGDAAFTRPHVSQFIVDRPSDESVEQFEGRLANLRSAIEREMAMTGMTQDDVRVLSCSAREITYGAIQGYEAHSSLYPDLAQITDIGFARSSQRRSHFA